MMESRLHGSLKSSSNTFLVVKRSLVHRNGCFVKSANPIKRGHVLLSENPILWVPLKRRARSSICHFCLCTTHSSRFSRCSICRAVFYCSRDCQSSHWHIHKTMCPVLKHNPSRVEEHVYMILSLLYANPSHITETLKDLLCDTNVDSLDDVTWNANLTRVALEVKADYDACSEVKMHSDQSASDLTYLYCRLKVNMFTISNTESHEEIAVGIYPTATSINHSCAPNAIYSFVNNKTLRLVSSYDLSEGDELLINYSPTPLSCTSPLERRSYLSSNYSFNCKCPLCYPAAARTCSNFRFHREHAELGRHLPSHLRAVYDRASHTDEALTAVYCTNAQCRHNVVCGFELYIDPVCSACGEMPDHIEVQGCIDCWDDYKANKQGDGYAQSAEKLYKLLRRCEGILSPVHYVVSAIYEQLVYVYLNLERYEEVYVYSFEFLIRLLTTEPQGSFHIVVPTEVCMKCLLNMGLQNKNALDSLVRRTMCKDFQTHFHILKYVVGFMETILGTFSKNTYNTMKDYQMLLRHAASICFSSDFSSQPQSF